MEDVTKALSYAVEVQVDPIVQTPGVAERLAEILMNPDGEADAGKRGAIKIVCHPLLVSDGRFRSPF